MNIPFFTCNLHEAFDETCYMFTGSEAAIKQGIAAFSRQPNLKDKLNSGGSISTIRMSGDGGKLFKLRLP